jgi:septum formation topological specificity factor MinE
MNMLRLKPVKAFMYQDHNAHITAHTNMMQDPAIQGMIGQSPMATQIMAAAQAHIAEHLAFAYRRQVQDAIGVPLPHPDEKLPEAAEVELSRMVAEGSQIVLAQHQAEAAQAQAQEQMQDPVMQVEMQKLQLQQAEIQRKAAKDQMDAQLKAQELAIKEQEASARMEMEGTKIGVDIAKSHSTLRANRNKPKGGSNQ